MDHGRPTFRTGHRSNEEGVERMKRLLMVAASVVVLVGATSSIALAGEIRPTRHANSTNETGALAHEFGCAASGLNDLDSAEGQNVSQVQTAADSWKYYGLPKGAPGTLGLCRGGTGQGSSPAWRGRGSFLILGRCSTRRCPEPGSLPLLADRSRLI